MEPTKKDKLKYRHQKYGCKNRLDKDGNKIEFKLTFDEWWDWWQATGHYHERGRKKGQYVMARLNDVGHYELGNIFCCTHSENVKSTDDSYKRTPEARANMSTARKGMKFTEEHKANMRKPKTRRSETQKPQVLP